MISGIQELKARVDLVELIEQDLGPASKKRKRWSFWRCPFHDDRNPSLGVTADNGRWKCFGCGLSGDHIDWLEQYHQMSKKEAIEELARLGNLAGEDYRPTHAKYEVVPQSAPPEGNWQKSAQDFVAWSQEHLWTDAGEPGLAYLRSGGLTEDTIRHFGLGWNPTDSYCDPEQWGLEPWTNANGRPGKIWLPRGIVIPCEVDKTLWYVKVRRFDSDGRPASDSPKYVQLKGSTSALFGTEDLHADGRPLLLCEGERDHMLAWQGLRYAVDVATLGGAGKQLHSRWLLRLLPYSRILAVYDTDDAGDKGVKKLANLSQRIEVVHLPHGSDLTEFSTNGGNLRALLQVYLGQKVGQGPYIGIDIKQPALGWEAEAEALLSESEPVTPEGWKSWCRRYAGIMQQGSAPCTGFGSWADWLADMEMFLTSRAGT